MMFVGDTSGNKEVLSRSEHEGGGNEDGLAGSTANEALGEVAEPTLHYGLVEGADSVGDMALDDIRGVVSTILTRSPVALLFDPVHRCRSD